MCALEIVFHTCFSVSVCDCVCVVFMSVLVSLCVQGRPGLRGRKGNRGRAEKGEKGEPGLVVAGGQGSGVFIPGPKGDKVRSDSGHHTLWRW